MPVPSSCPNKPSMSPRAKRRTAFFDFRRASGCASTCRDSTTIAECDHPHAAVSTREPAGSCGDACGDAVGDVCADTDESSPSEGTRVPPPSGGARRERRRNWRKAATRVGRQRAPSAPNPNAPSSSRPHA